MTVVRFVFISFITLAMISAVDAASQWHVAKSDHFVVHYKNAPLRFVQSVSDRAELIYKKTATGLGFTRYKGWIGGARVNIYISDNAQDYRTASGYGWAAGSTNIATRTIATYPSARGFFDSTLPHEIGHIVFRDFIGPDVKVPLWVEEGVAMYQEEGHRWGVNDTVRQAMAEGRCIPIDDLNGMELTGSSDKALVSLFYAQAASLVNFLITEGETTRFARLCREIRDGARFDHALKRSYMKYRSLQDMETAWKEYIAHEKK